MPTEDEIAQLFAIHNSDERRRENLMRAYGFDTTRTWVDPNGYTLSTRVWRARREVYSQIDQVLREAIANGTDALEVADVLEQYLDPAYAPVRNARGRLMRNQAKGIVTQAPGRAGMGSFPARRLARTEITRAHGQATIETAKRTPFATGVKWNLSGSHPRSDPCDENSRRDAFDLGPGVYPPNDVPQYPNHPHCLCNLSTATERDVDAVVRQLREQYGLETTQATEIPTAAGGEQDEVSTLMRDVQRGIDRGEIDLEEWMGPGGTLADMEAALRADASMIEVARTDVARTRKALGRVDLASFTSNPRTLPNTKADLLDAGRTEAVDALFQYKGSGYGAINGRLRGRTLTAEQIKYADQNIPRIDEAFDATPLLKSDIKLYRGISARSTNNPWRTANPGDVIQDQGYFSTSFVEERRFQPGRDGVTMEIYAPAGSTRGISLDTVNAVGDNIEHEVLLPRGTTFLIRSRERRYAKGEISTYWDHLVVEIVP